MSLLAKHFQPTDSVTQALRESAGTPAPYREQFLTVLVFEVSRITSKYSMNAVLMSD